MNYYIDFDKTLYDSMALTEDLLNVIVTFINKETSTPINIIKKECKSMFNREHIYNIFELAEYFANKYSVRPDLMLNNINNIVSNGSCYVYEDVFPFLTKLKESGHTVHMLTVDAAKCLNYQTKKVLGSGLVDYFDTIILTQKPKYMLDLDYSTGIFIDDNPEDLLGLYSKNPVQVIRLRKPTNKYSAFETNNPNIKEYVNLTDIPIKND